MAISDRYVFPLPASVAAFAAHIFGIIAFVLLLVWLFHFQGGINLNSENDNHIFNVHPFLMFLGFAVAAGEAIMVYKIFPGGKVYAKVVHWSLLLSALVMAIIGIYAVYKYHDRIHEPQVATLHSWTGMGTVCLLGFQWLFGFLAFVYPKAPSRIRVKMVPWHAFAGLVIFLLAICCIQMGISEQFIFTGVDAHSKQARVMNFIGIMSLLYGFSVVLTVILPR